MHDEPEQDHYHLHVDLNQQYHFVALSRPATSTGNNPAEQEEVNDVDDEKNIIAGRSNSLVVLLCVILPMLLSSQFYMTLLLHNESESTAHLFPTMVMLSMLLFALTLYVLFDSVGGGGGGGGMGGLRNLRSLMMIVLLTEILVDVLLLLVLWEKIEPRLALLAGSLVISTCIIIISARHLHITCFKGDFPNKRRRRFGSFVLV